MANLVIAVIVIVVNKFNVVSLVISFTFVISVNLMILVSLRM